MPTRFVEWLKQGRKTLDLTQEELAARVGCATETIRKLEVGRRRPSKEIAHRLADVLELSPEERAAFLKSARGELVVDHLPASSPANPPTGRTPRHNLPVQRDPLIGRERELADVAGLLRRADVGLVTLSGPGGTGKTRLALQTAADVLDDFTDGVWFIDLAPLSDPTLIPSTIAQTLGVRETGDQPVEAALTSYVRDKQLLLVLDNFEQIVAGASFVTDLLMAAPQLKVLVTSREVLHVDGEYEYPVPLLPVPDLQQLPPLDRLSQYAAVALFIQRARAVRPDFQVTDATAPAVAEICVRLDGLPLAIELAAVRVKLFAPQALLARLDRRLRLLTGGSRRTSRQQTLRHTLDWSFSLLTPAMQRLFARLGIFVGGCTTEAAEAVCNTDGDLGIDVLEGLVSLVDKSLLRVAEGRDGEPRFSMLETIHEYAVEQLDQRGERNQLALHQSAYGLRLVERVHAAVGQPDEDTWFRRLVDEHDNLRAALQWCITHERVEQAADLAVGLSLCWYFRGYLAEGRQWLAHVLEHGRTLTPVTRFRLQRYLGKIMLRQGDPAALPVSMSNLELARALDDPRLLASALEDVGLVADVQGEHARAVGLYSEALGMARTLHDQGMIASIQHHLGLAFAGQHVFDQAEAALAAAIASARDHGERGVLALSLHSLGDLMSRRGNHAQAGPLLQESLRLGQALDHIWIMLGNVMSLGNVAAATGNPARAARLWGAGTTFLARTGAPAIVSDAAAEPQYLLAVREQLGVAVFEAVWAEGQAMSLEQAIAYAIEPTATFP